MDFNAPRMIDYFILLWGTTTTQTYHSVLAIIIIVIMDYFFYHIPAVRWEKRQYYLSDIIQV